MIDWRSPEGAQLTELRVEGSYGIVARVGQRLLGSTSKMMMNQFFGCIQAEIDGKV